MADVIFGIIEHGFSQHYAAQKYGISPYKVDLVIRCRTGQRSRFFKLFPICRLRRLKAPLSNGWRP
jgi:hypothetical protein